MINLMNREKEAVPGRVLVIDITRVTDITLLTIDVITVPLDHIVEAVRMIMGIFLQFCLTV